MIRYFGLKADDEALGSILEPGTYAQLGLKISPLTYEDLVVTYSP